MWCTLHVIINVHGWLEIIILEQAVDKVLWTGPNPNIMLQTARGFTSLRLWTQRQLQTRSGSYLASSDYLATAAFLKQRWVNPSSFKAATVSTTPRQLTQLQEKNDDGHDKSSERIKPYEEIPTPKRIPLLKISRDFAKVAKNPFQVVNFIKERVEEFGTIYREKVSPGLPEFLFVLDPKDIEKVFRADGKYPRRFSITEWIEARKKTGIPVGIFLT